MTGETKIAIFADTPTTMSRNPDNRKRAPIPVPEPAPLPDPETIDIEGIFNDYRKVVPFISDDVYMHPLIQKSIEFIR